MEKFWNKWLKSDILQRTEQLKIIVDIIERSWKELDVVKDKLESKKIDTKWMKAQFLNTYFEDLEGVIGK